MEAIRPLSINQQALATVDWMDGQKEVGKPGVESIRKIDYSSLATQGQWLIFAFGRAKGNLAWLTIKF